LFVGSFSLLDLVLEDLVLEDLVLEDLVLEDLVLEDLVLEDLVLEDLELELGLFIGTGKEDVAESAAVVVRDVTAAVGILVGFIVGVFVGEAMDKMSGQQPCTFIENEVT
jgi:hypothetical protein